MSGFSVGATERLLNFDPDTLAIVAVTASRIAPTIPISLAVLPLPVVRHDAELQGRLVIALLFHAPAVAVFIADNCGRSGASGQGQEGRAAKALLRVFISNLHFYAPS